MIQLEIPKKARPLIQQAHQVASSVFRPISRKYDHAEHTYPKELDMLAALMDGMAQGGQGGSVNDVAQSHDKAEGKKKKRGNNLQTLLGMVELCWGDTGLALTIPRQGLGNAAVAAVASPEQKARWGNVWAAMAITEPGAGSDSAAIRTTAHLEGDEWVINGEKIYVTAGERASGIVVWATLDKNLGRAAIKSFFVPQGAPGMRLVRLDKKMGIRASDTAVIEFVNCRIPKDNILGSAEIDTKKGFGGVMQTFDNTRPLVAGMSIGVSRAALEVVRELLEKAGVKADYEGAFWNQQATLAETYRMEAELEAARLLTMRAAYLADTGTPNSKEASMAKAKAGRTGTYVTLKAVELAGDAGYTEKTLLEKWARDSKILDIFEGTQQIQLLIVARAVLGLKSSQLR